MLLQHLKVLRSILKCCCKCCTAFTVLQQYFQCCGSIFSAAAAFSMLQQHFQCIFHFQMLHLNSILMQHLKMLPQHFLMLHLVPKSWVPYTILGPSFLVPNAAFENAAAAFHNAASMNLNHMHTEILKVEFWPMGSQHLIMWLGSKPIRGLHFQKKEIWSLRYWIQSQHLKCCGSIFKCCIWYQKAGSHILYWDPAFWYQMQH